jgi:hypothetical protein
LGEGQVFFLTERGHHWFILAFGDTCPVVRARGRGMGPLPGQNDVTPRIDHMACTVADWDARKPALKAELERRGSNYFEAVRQHAPITRVHGVASPNRQGVGCRARRSGRRRRRADRRRPGLRALREPEGMIGVLDDHAGDAQVAGDLLHPPRTGAMFPAVAIAARRAASLAAMHPAAGPAADRRRAAGRAGAGARAAARRGGEDCRLTVVGWMILHISVPARVDGGGRLGIGDVP